MKNASFFLALIISTPSALCMEHEYTEIPLHDFKSKKATKEEKKPLLKISSLGQPDFECMQQLYTQANNLIYSYESMYHSKYLTNIAADQGLNVLLKTIDSACAKNITLDHMMAFTTEQKPFLGYDNTPTTYIFFACLKRYKNKNEASPFAPIKKDSHTLSQILGITTEVESTNKQLSIRPRITYSHLKKFPAYLKLIDSCKTLFPYHPDIREDLVSFLATNKNITHKNSYPTGSNNLKNDFYEQAYKVVASKKIDLDTLYNLLDIIQTAKSAQYINNEQELGYGILNFEPERDFFNFDPQYDLPTTKNLISLLCTLLELHNKPKKITTTKEQYLANNLQKNIALSFPNSFKNDVFNTEKYALMEFEELEKNILKLMSSTEQEVTDAVKAIYYSKKINAEQ